MEALQDLKTPGQVEEKYQIMKATLATWRSRKKGPTWVKRMGRVYYPAAELEKWIADNTVVHNPEAA